MSVHRLFMNSFQTKNITLPLIMKNEWNLKHDISFEVLFIQILSMQCSKVSGKVRLMTSLEDTMNYQWFDWSTSIQIHVLIVSTYSCSIALWYSAASVLILIVVATCGPAESSGSKHLSSLNSQIDKLLTDCNPKHWIDDLNRSFLESQLITSKKEKEKKSVKKLTFKVSSLLHQNNNYVTVVVFWLS